MSWQHPVCVAIDFETAGNYQGCACAIGMARIEDMRITDTFYSLIRPPSSRVYYTRIHGLTWAILKDAPPFADVWGQAADFMAGAAYLVAHNATFDRGVLYSCCDVFGIGQPEQPFLCTLKGSRRALGIESHSLDNVCGYFGIQLDHHHAGSDAAGCAMIFTKLLKRGLTVGDMQLKNR